MPSAFRDQKNLPDWVETDYFRRRRRLSGLRRRLGWVALFLCLAGLSWTLWPGQHHVYQAGPVSTAHAFFNHDCKQCHTEAFTTATRLWPANHAARSVPDEACIRCHAGPIHHEQQTHQSDCASCHREHRGEAILARVDDAKCVSCHADLQRKDGGKCAYENVSNFSLDHPEFAVVRDKKPDPSAVHFNHERHLKGVEGPDGEVVKLECNACHRPDSAGGHMEPIRYDRHCRMCHPLSVQLVGEWPEEKLKTAAERFADKPAPHVEPTAVRAALRDRLIGFIKDNPAVIPNRSEPPERQIPGSSKPSPVDQHEWEWVHSQLGKIENVLLQGAGGCRFCHVPSGVPPVPAFAKTNIPRRWLPHGHFSHESHRQLVCTECHAAGGSRTAVDVLMPSVESCKQCHNPQVGARHDCLECHSYHDKSKDRDRTGTMTIREALAR